MRKPNISLVSVLLTVAAMLALASSVGAGFLGPDW